LKLDRVGIFRIMSPADVKRYNDPCKAIDLDMIQRDIHCGKLMEVKWPDAWLVGKLTRLLHHTVFPSIGQSHVLLTTRMKSRSGRIFRADPEYNFSYMYPWHDWTYITFENETIAHRILIFICINQLREPFVLNGSTVSCDGTYAVCEFIEQDLSGTPRRYNEPDFLSHRESFLFYWARPMLIRDRVSDELCIREGCLPDDWNEIMKQRNPIGYEWYEEDLLETLLCFVHVDVIDNPCIAVADRGDPPNDDDTFACGYIFVRPRREWPKLLFDKMEVQLKHARDESSHWSTDNTKRKRCDSMENPGL